MRNKSILALCVLSTFGISQAAFADSDGSDSSPSDMGAMSNMAMGDDNAQMGGDMQMGMMGGDMMSMMQNMMKMHASMMSGGNGMMGGGNGMMGGGNGMMGGGNGMMGANNGMMGMMDRDMMSMMMPGGDAQNLPAHMGAKLREFDSDADGALTMGEFEALHMNAVRDRMVDRFQHLDADGDGQISMEEMNSAGTRMGTMLSR